MSDQSAGEGIRERLTSTGEAALGKLAQDLLENPLVNGAIARAFEAREKAVQAQEVALGALNIPTAADIERLTRRVRSVSQRLEGIEDAVDRLDERIAGMAAQDGLQDRLAALERQLERITAQLASLDDAVRESGARAKVAAEEAAAARAVAAKPVTARPTPRRKSSPSK
jgi:chromosome segregation ATPase